MPRDAPDHAPPVAIVGGGPVGLSLALGLARQGVRSVLVERKETTSEHSKAPGIHVRTREVFRQWSVEQRFVDAGLLAPAIRLHPADGGRPLLALDMAELEDEAERPGILVLEQGRTEALLLDAVRDTGMCDARFGAEAVALEHGADGARLTVREGGAEQRIDAEYVIGCDGASSFVRGALGLSFDGITYSIRPMLADVRVDDARDGLPWPRIRNGGGGITIGIRLGGGLWRIIRIEPGEPGGGDEVPDEEALRRAGEVLGDGPTEVVWSSRFRTHARSVPRFRAGRVVLAGDAAHLHSPVGGQGMNAGIHDAHNLAWKLAHALRGGDADRLLDSYDVERRAAVVERVTRYTDLLTRAFLQTPSLVRTSAFFLLRAALKVPRVRRAMLRRTAMIDLDYPASPLLEEGDRAAGVRLPDVVLTTPRGADVRLYDLLPDGPAILEVGGPRDVRVDLPLEDVLRIGPGAHADRSGFVRDLLEGDDGWILVRPDRHVAWARTRPEGMEDAVRRALGGVG